MKKSIQIIATALVMLFGNSALSQNDTMYVMKNGYITHSILVDYNHVDSIIFYKPVELATLITTTISSITETSALSGGNITNNGGATVTSRGICWGTSPNPTPADNSSVNGSGLGSFKSNLTGLNINTIYYVRAYARNSAGTAYGNEVSFNSFITDADGNAYTSVTIGTQEWIVENLRTTKYSDGTAIPNVIGSTDWGNLSTGAWSHYDNDSSQYEATYGKLYNWYAASDSRNVCPIGWHVPSEADWTVLNDYLRANRGSLKATSGWNDYDGQIGNGTDDYGWLGFPGGVRRFNGNFNHVGYNGNWWSSSWLPIDCECYPWDRLVYYFIGSEGGWDGDKRHGFSVRCLRD